MNNFAVILIVKLLKPVNRTSLKVAAPPSFFKYNPSEEIEEPFWNTTG